MMKCYNYEPLFYFTTVNHLNHMAYSRTIPVGIISE